MPGNTEQASPQPVVTITSAAKGAEAYIREEDGGLADHPVISIFGSFLAAAAVSVVQVALTINDLLNNETLSASINEAQELLDVTIERPKPS
ncbi:hypothetical protein [Lentzea albida]|uniref:Uncharacterized protein n=1 Tax=Lentzea albida TaxID=65499 RepID=A0A1H9WSM0_9PSEU|nr:hypothetical protein [Lentzea albida]SES36928.1 hypothetical protein SAMN04488000_12478 [Lentzea albida]